MSNENSRRKTANIFRVLVYSLLGFLIAWVSVKYFNNQKMPWNEMKMLMLGIVGAGMLLVIGLKSLENSTPSGVIKVRENRLVSDENNADVKKKLGVNHDVWAGQLGDADLGVSMEDRAVVIGPPGTGKTAFLVNQLLRWIDSGRPFVCLDIKPEIYGIVRARLQTVGYRVFTFNPTAGTGERYNPLADIEGPEGVGELSAALIPASAEEAAVFNESARDFLDAIISHLRATVGPGTTLPDVRDFVAQFSDYKQLLQTLFESPDTDARVIASSLNTVARNERLLGSIFATLQSNLRFLRFPQVRDALSGADFSLADVGREKSALFLQFEESHRETTARLWVALVAHVLRYFIVHTQRPPLLLLLDEIGNAPPVPGIVQKLNTIRSRQLPTWLYFQSKEQMQPYGMKADEGPNIILGACDFQMVFRLNDNASAAWFSEKIGVMDQLIVSTSVSRSTDGSATVGNSQQLKTEPIIYPHELQQLKDGECVATYRGKAWRGQATPYFESFPEFRGRGVAAAGGRGTVRLVSQPLQTGGGGGVSV